MPEEAFSIAIVSQGWLAGCSPEEDLCSHGRIRLVIGGVVVSPGDEEYGISESALALLRTLTADHTSECPVAERLVFHGCGAILMMGCPIGIDWDVRHAPGAVELSDVRRYETTDGRPVLYPQVRAALPAEDYRRAVVAFAAEAKALFAGVPKAVTDSFDREQYTAFWQEYERHLARFGTPAEPARCS